MKQNTEPAHVILLTDEELDHLMIFLRISGVREKREMNKYQWDLRNGELHTLGKVLKKLRKAGLFG